MTYDMVIGYDGSHAATGAIDVAAQLFPGARAQIVHMWTPPFTTEGLRRRLRATAANADELGELTEREGQREAERIARTGATLATAAGLDAGPLVKRCWGGGGETLARLAQELSADVVAVGSRGLGATHALLGGVAEAVVHHAYRPTLVVPWPLLSAEYDALPDGPVVVGWDDSAGANTALATARRLLGDRDMLVAVVGDETAEEPAAADRQETVRVRRSGSSAKATAGALLALAERRKAAAVVVGSRGRSTARKLLLGSVASATVHAAHRAVLVAPNA
jgi:nucleotide-binding universal stress UspA family protein